MVSWIEITYLQHSAAKLMHSKPQGVPALHGYWVTQHAERGWMQPPKNLSWYWNWETHLHHPNSYAEVNHCCPKQHLYGPGSCWHAGQGCCCLKGCLNGCGLSEKTENHCQQCYCLTICWFHCLWVWSTERGLMKRLSLLNELGLVSKKQWKLCSYQFSSLF